MEFGGDCRNAEIPSNHLLAAPNGSVGQAQKSTSCTTLLRAAKALSTLKPNTTHSFKALATSN
jgi:hypothetical protein